MAENDTAQEDLQDPQQDQQEQTLMDHLVELRDRLLHMVLLRNNSRTMH